MSVDTTTLAQLAPGFTGRLLQPTDAEYEDARRVHNGLVDKRPAIIARCRGVADICDAIKLARALNMDVHDEAGDPAAAAYGANYSRLRELKAKYDPENFFHANVNIRPA
jgi:hypothetical protein